MLRSVLFLNEHRLLDNIKCQLCDYEACTYVDAPCRLSNVDFARFAFNSNLNLQRCVCTAMERFTTWCAAISLHLTDAFNYCSMFWFPVLPCRAMISIIACRLSYDFTIVPRLILEWIRTIFTNISNTITLSIDSFPIYHHDVLYEEQLLFSDCVAGLQCVTDDRKFSLLFSEQFAIKDSDTA